jgi:hypothetical protein
MTALLTNTLYFSIAVQILTVIVGFFGLLIKLPIKDEILRSLIGLETLVSCIQLSFYTWYSYHFNEVSHSTSYRYHDWVITTPIMLFTTMLYYDYNNVDTPPETIESFWNKYKKQILVVFGFNGMMLLFGYLHEIGILDLLTSNILGFVGLAGSFYVQYDAFAKHSVLNMPVFLFVSFIWSLYGIAAMFTPLWKNISYNIIDTISKNFYAIFLTYIAYQKSVSM